jgi:hypothetical protein
MRIVAKPFFLAIVLLQLASCQMVDRGGVQDRQAIRRNAWIRTDLYFGLTRRDSSVISDADFQGFMDQVVTPDFPDGLTVTAASGQYLDSKGALHREPARVLTVLYPEKDAETCNQKIENITAVYCRNFDQESVLRTNTLAMTEFLSASQ